MRTINKYIIEKLKLNNDIKINTDNVELYQKYNKGDKCLWIREFSINRREYMCIDVIRITKITKTIIEYTHITNTSGAPNSVSVKFNRNNKNDKYLSISGMSDTTMFVTSEDSKDILDKIESNDKKLDFYNTLWKDSRGDDDYSVLMERVRLTGNRLKDFEKMSDETFKNIKDSL